MLIRTVIFGIMYRVFMVLQLCDKMSFSISNDIPSYPAVSFVFGDSLIDVGNNKYIVSLAKANYHPYGLDFGKPTGRFTFTNGRTVIDVTCQQLGLPIAPPYLAPTTTVSVVLQQGVNYASGSGGILINSGNILRLFSLGARKIDLSNVGPINGCMPFEREINPDAGDNSVTFPNQLAQSFNTQLKSLVAELRTNLKGSLFLYADVYHIVEDILLNYKAYGFKNPNSACCHMAGRFGGLITCIPESKVREDRSKYIFWDCHHPSDATNVIIAQRLSNGGTNDISPMDVRQLSQA